MTIIPNNSTIASIIGKLSDPDGYVAGVFQNAHDCLKACKTSYVRIGIMGKGRSPHYRTEYDEFGYTYPIPIFKTFDGRNHKVLIENDDILLDEHWSSERMSYEQVRELLGQIRGFAVKSKAHSID